MALVDSKMVFGIRTDDDFIWKKIQHEIDSSKFHVLWLIEWNDSMGKYDDVSFTFRDQKKKKNYSNINWPLFSADVFITTKNYKMNAEPISN